MAAAAQPQIHDTMAQRALACAACHGKEGRATRDGYFPRIAGKPAGYLYNQLINFREGRRRYPLMTYMVGHLSDAYLAEMAQYFSELDVPTGLRKLRATVQLRLSGAACWSCKAIQRGNCLRAWHATRSS